jgi:myo-inositol catabolism protein IolC
VSHAGKFAPQAFLAFDHRNLFERLLAQSSIPEEERFATIACIKDMIHSAAVHVVSHSQMKLPLFAILVDEKYAATVLLNAKVQKIPVALAVERNEAAQFTLEYGENWKSHAQALAPNYIKVLINWSSNNSNNEPTIALLLQLFQWTNKNEYGLLLEIIPEAGKTDVLIQATRQIRTLGINPRFWKIPVPASIDEAEKIIKSAMASDLCVPEIFLLGGSRSAPDARAAILPFLSIPGISGWAVGRAIWGDAVTNYVAGRISEKECIESITQELIDFLKIISPIQASSLHEDQDKR